MRYTICFYLLIISFTTFAQNFYMLTGTYTTGKSKGIYVYRFDASKGTATLISSTDSVANPSYLAIAANGQYVYAVNETSGKPGQVSSFSFNRTNGKLTFINQQPSGGTDPCYVSVNKKGNWVFVANYSGGNLSALPVEPDGSLKPFTQLIQDTGSGVNKQRQEKPHVHTVVFSPAQDYVFYTDLGLDKMMIYRFNSNETQPLQPAEIPFVPVTPGSGPRHIAFHPNKTFAYLIEELSGTIDAYKYKDGEMSYIQRIATHPANYKGEIGSADIHVSPDGKFLYASNRGDENNITIFSIDPVSGKLTLKGYQSSMGITPRNFIIDPTGHYLLVAHQKTNNIVIFKRNMQTGLLQYTGRQLKVPSPVCIQMINVK